MSWWLWRKRRPGQSRNLYTVSGIWYTVMLASAILTASGTAMLHLHFAPTLAWDGCGRAGAPPSG
jgi:hypothetical protein